MFQFLIVRLKSVAKERYVFPVPFQFLIVRLKSDDASNKFNPSQQFQFLIVRLKFLVLTRPHPFLHSFNSL